MEVCVDYRELNKATRKDHFPLPFIDQVLDALAGKNYFSFLDGFSGYNQIYIIPEDQDKTTFTFPLGHIFLQGPSLWPLQCSATFQRVVLNIFSYIFHDTIEIYMDDFTPYGNSFQEALINLENVLKMCEEMNLSLSHEKCNMLMSEGIVLGHHISSRGIEVDQAKVNIIKYLPRPPPKKKICKKFSWPCRYYRRFIKYFSKLASPLFTLLSKDIDFCWIKNAKQPLKILKKNYLNPVLQGPKWNIPFHIHT
jgi:hypothetical protein